MAKQSARQKAVVGRVMHAFKEGDLETRGHQVRSPRQAIAIALHEAGASREVSDAANRRALAQTEARATKPQLLEEARRRDIRGRSRMTVAELRCALGQAGG